MLLPLVFGVTLLTFILVKALPGDPVQGLIGERASAEAVENIRARIGENRSLPGQFIGYLGMLMHGEFGRSLYTNREVGAEIAAKLPNTLALALGAMAVATPFGVMLGFIAAARRGSRVDHAITTLSVLGISMPVFWVGLLLMLLLSFALRLVPPSGTGELKFLVLPVITLALPAMATLARVSRSSIIDALALPCVTVARAKGLPAMRIRLVHILKNALVPIVTVVGLDFGSYINGAVLTETIFGWDGIGRYAMEGIIKRDYPVVMGTIVVGTVAFILVNLIVDMAYQYLDPRVRPFLKAGNR
jgi:ABC-type dipeptide/oligopeptide/nickel transport system permease component